MGDLLPCSQNLARLIDRARQIGYAGWAGIGEAAVDLILVEAKFGDRPDSWSRVFAVVFSDPVGWCNDGRAPRACAGYHMVTWDCVRRTFHHGWGSACCHAKQLFKALLAFGVHSTWRFLQAVALLGHSLLAPILVHALQMIFSAGPERAMVMELFNGRRMLAALALLEVAAFICMTVFSWCGWPAVGLAGRQPGDITFVSSASKVVKCDSTATGTCNCSTVSRRALVAETVGHRQVCRQARTFDFPATRQFAHPVPSDLLVTMSALGTRRAHGLTCIPVRSTHSDGNCFWRAVSSVHGSFSGWGEAKRFILARALSWRKQRCLETLEEAAAVWHVG